ncbi:MAG: hypothetical protein U9N37_04120, partial [Thermodesulfobacteriota bacterium]|nr:hypothetical protein [Thermodesulfobacteriota bacterium]
KSALLRAIEVLKEEGLKSLWFKLLGETVYRRVVVVERILDELIHPMTSRIPVTIKLMEKSDVGEYCEFYLDADRSDIQQRLDSGHWCFTARHQGHIVHTCWAATQVFWFNYLSYEIQLASDEAFIYDSYTDPSYRGLNIAATRSVVMMRFFHSAGFRRLLGVVAPENQSAVRIPQKSGYHPIGTLGFFKIGPIKQDFGEIKGHP